MGLKMRLCHSVLQCPNMQITANIPSYHPPRALAVSRVTPDLKSASQIEAMIPCQARNLLANLHKLLNFSFPQFPSLLGSVIIGLTFPASVNIKTQVNVQGVWQSSHHVRIQVCQKLFWAFPVQTNQKLESLRYVKNLISLCPSLPSSFETG